MGEYRKKPVIVEAQRWWKDRPHPAVRMLTESNQPLDTTGGHCGYCGIIYLLHGWVSTKEGGHIVCPGDWIVTGVQGERYPCKPDIFQQTYEPV